MNDAMYWAPEIYWYKIKQHTGIDINDVKEIYRMFHQENNKCKECENRNKMNLKKKLSEYLYWSNYKKQHQNTV